MNEKNNHYPSIPFADLESCIGNASLGTEEIEGLDTRCHIHIHSRRKRLTDPDGVSAKAAIDAIVIAGLLPDDSAQHIKEVSYSQEKAEVEETIITLEWEDL